MIDISTQAGKEELIAELRRRDAAGLIGSKRFSNDDGTPCCPFMHAVEATGGYARSPLTTDYHAGTGGPFFNVLGNVLGISDVQGPAAGITQLAKNLGVVECSN